MKKTNSPKGHEKGLKVEVKVKAGSVLPDFLPAHDPKLPVNWATSDGLSFYNTPPKFI